MLVALPGVFDPAGYYDTPGTTSRSSNAARTISAVGEYLSPSGVAYFLRPSAHPALSGTGNWSSPSTLIVGLPARQPIQASACRPHDHVQATHGSSWRSW